MFGLSPLMFGLHRSKHLWPAPSRPHVHGANGDQPAASSFRFDAKQFQKVFSLRPRLHFVKRPKAFSAHVLDSQHVFGRVPQHLYYARSASLALWLKAEFLRGKSHQLGQHGPHVRLLHGRADQRVVLVPYEPALPQQ